MVNKRASLLMYFIFGIVVLAGFGDVAVGQDGCGVTIIKDAPGGGNKEFPFEVTVDGNGPFSFTLTDGETNGGPFSTSVTVTELPIAGWTLSDISCENEGATGFEVTENGFTASCDGGGEVTCTFFNLGTITNIPTLSELGMIIAATGLGLIGAIFSFRRKKMGHA